jgi:hypothetical protein
MTEITFSTTEPTRLNPLTDTLTARVGEHGKVFLVFESEEHGRHAWPVSEDPKGRDAATLLSLAWKLGEISLGKWQWAEQYVPLHRHDCEQCVFLGAVTSKATGRHGDVWTCPHEPETVIVRWSSEPSDNTTTPLRYAFADSRPWARDAAEVVAMFLGIDLPAGFFLTDPRNAL